MPSKLPPTSVRLGKDRGALVQAYATDHGLKLGAAILALVDLGLQRVTLPVTAAVGPQVSATSGQLKNVRSVGADIQRDNAKARAADVLAQAERKAAHLAKPRPKSKWSLKGVHLGPVDTPPGSRLKGSTPKKRGA